MNPKAIFELYPDPAIIAASRYGAEPCAPPVATLDAVFLMTNEDLAGILAGPTVSKATIGITAPRTWRVRAGCPFVSCASHARGTLYLSANVHSRAELEAYLRRLPPIGWNVRADHVAAYGLRA